MKKPTRVVLATMYGVGLVKKAPGTAGSAVSALMAYGILQLPHGLAILALALIVLTLLGTWSVARYMTAFNTPPDPKEAVIDELSGQWLTYLIWYEMLGGAAANYGVALGEMQIDQQPFFMLLGFLLFRFFDILKPWPISWADRHIKGAFGVMFDDILAAIPAGVLLYFAYVYSPLLLGSMESAS